MLAAESYEADCIYGCNSNGVPDAMDVVDEGEKASGIYPSRGIGDMIGGTTALHMDCKEAECGLGLKLLMDGDDPGMRAQNKAELVMRNIHVIYEHRISAS
jgi:hypothetical protein